MIRIFSLLFFISSCAFAQTKMSLDESRKAQEKLNEHYINPETSILSEADFETFEGLEFFDLNEKYIVMAKFTHIPDQEPFEMPTTTERLPVYVKYAALDFELEGKTLRLYAYQNIDLSKQEGYEDYLFLPFYDLTNGIETYGGGRYMDIRIPENDFLYLDFNRVYNPYCVYNHKYSCPIPPAENDLDIEIRAGVKVWESKLD